MDFEKLAWDEWLDEGMEKIEHGKGNQFSPVRCFVGIGVIHPENTGSSLYGVIKSSRKTLEIWDEETGLILEVSLPLVEDIKSILGQVMQ